MQVTRAENDALLRVRDTGRGIYLKRLESIFDLFLQGTETLDRAEGGMAIGLSVVRSIVEMHGGTVQAKSEGPGAGRCCSSSTGSTCEHARTVRAAFWKF